MPSHFCGRTKALGTHALGIQVRNLIKKIMFIGNKWTRQHEDGQWMRPNLKEPTHKVDEQGRAVESNPAL